MSILAGKRVLVTRALEQNSELISKLEFRQAIALVYPCLEIAFLPFGIPNKQFDWVVFTSQNAVKALAGREFQAKQVLAPPIFNSKSLAKIFENKPPQKILLPQGDLADDFLKNTLEQQGHEVTRLTVYSTRKPANPVDFNFGYLDAITFTSPSAARYFQELSKLTPHPALSLKGRGRNTVIACIGTTTYQAAIDLGFKNIIYAKEHSLEGLVQILEDYFTCSNAQHD